MIALDKMLRIDLVRVLQHGPQNMRPPNVARLSKSDLLRCIHRALAAAEGSQARIGMQASVDEVQRLSEKEPD